MTALHPVNCCKSMTPRPMNKPRLAGVVWNASIIGTLSRSVYIIKNIFYTSDIRYLFFVKITLDICYVVHVTDD